MVRTTAQKCRPLNEEIDVSVFKDIQIRFPGDVYILAVWLAMSDRSKSTSTSRPHTTLHGLARNFAMLYGTDYSNPLTSDDVTAVFRRQGITGNPLLRLDATPGDDSSLPTIGYTARQLASPVARIDEHIKA